MKIPFDIKFRPQIESGEYKVETKDYHPVRIICWNKNTGGFDRIVALVAGDSGKEKTLHYTEEGWCVASGGNKNKDLFIITPEPELTEFEQEVRVCVTKNLTTHIKDGNGGEMSSTVFIGNDTAKKMAAELFELTRKTLCKGCAAKLEGYINGRDDARKEMDKLYKHGGPTPPVYWPPCYYGGPCINPHYDCINCPGQSADRINTITGTLTAKVEGKE